MTGLPKAVEDLLGEGVSTFLRRAELYDLQATSIPEVKAAFQASFQDGGADADDEHLDMPATATGTCSSSNSSVITCGARPGAPGDR